MNQQQEHLPHRRFLQVHLKLDNRQAPQNSYRYRSLTWNLKPSRRQELR